MASTNLKPVCIALAEALVDLLGNEISQETGSVRVTRGVHTLNVPLDNLASRVYAVAQSTSVSHCGGTENLDLVGVKIIPGGFELTANISSDTAIVYYLAVKK